MGAAIPVMHYNRHGRRQFHALCPASGPVSRRKYLHTWHRGNCRRHLYRPRLALLTSWMDKRVSSTRWNCRRGSAKAPGTDEL